MSRGVQVLSTCGAGKRVILFSPCHHVICKKQAIYHFIVVGLGIPTPVYALSAFVNAASAPKSMATDGENSCSGAARVLAANKHVHRCR